MGGDRYIVGLLAAVVFHAGALALLDSAERDRSDDWNDETEVEVENEPEPDPKKPEPKPEPPKPEPEPVLEEPAIVKKVDPKPQPKRSEPKRTPPPVQPDDVDEETAGGDPSLPAPGGTFNMPDIVPGGTAMGGVGNSKSSGKGGSGAGTKPGGDGGKGKGTSKPVSIASIKTRAKALNASDVITDRRFNDVTGEVVIKLIISSGGAVTKATVIKRLKPDVDRFALGQAKKLKFRPAIDQNDKPVSSVVNWKFTFRPPT